MASKKSHTNQHNRPSRLHKLNRQAGPSEKCLINAGNAACESIHDKLVCGVFVCGERHSLSFLWYFASHSSLPVSEQVRKPGRGKSVCKTASPFNAFVMLYVSEQAVEGALKEKEKIVLTK
eukprot:1161410-Pelagomonas_calceolata.AAC.5